MKTELFKIITGQDIITQVDEKTEIVIDGFMAHKDYILFVAEEKQGKTIFAQQLACSLSSGTPLLDTFDIPKKCVVWYFVTEGKVEAIKDRFERIDNKVVADFNNIVLIPTFFRYNTEEGAQALTDIVNRLEDKKPDVIIIDALYRAVKGSLKNDDVVNDFHFIVQKLSEHLDCSVVLVHHMTKPSRNDKGNYYNRSDKDSFGSAFLAAGVDHVFWLEKARDSEDKNEKFLRCDTQRSGDIIESVRLKLKGRDPLYFEMVDRYLGDENKIVKILHGFPNGANFDELSQRSRITNRTKMYQILKDLEAKELIEKIGTRPKLFKLLNYNDITRY